MQNGPTKQSCRRLFPRALIGAAGLFLSACNDVKAAPEVPSPRADLVALGDGTTMVARQGSLSRDIADWLASEGADSRSYFFGSDAFRPETAQLSPVGLSRAVDLGTLLRATPSAKLVLYGSRNEEDSLAESRSTTLTSFLNKRGILAGQVRVATADDVPPSASPHQQSGTLSFRLHRGPSVVSDNPDS